MAALDVDDTQTPMSKMGPTVVIKAKIVRAAMANRLSHASQDLDRALGGLSSDKPGYAAHDKECELSGQALNHVPVFNCRR